MRRLTRAFALTIASGTGSAFQFAICPSQVCSRAHHACSQNGLWSSKVASEHFSVSSFAAREAAPKHKFAVRPRQRQGRTQLAASSSEMFASPLSPGSKGVEDAPVGGVGKKSAIMAAAVALGSGFLAFAIEQGGTFLILEALMKATGTTSIRALFEFLTAWGGSCSWAGVAATVGFATILQLLPLCNGILLMMTLGSMFGTIQGVAIASVACTTSALVCMLLARTMFRETFAGREPALLKAVGASIASSSAKSLLIVCLFRLSPVVPFCWSNYLFGLTEVGASPYIAGTLIGTLPAITAFVSAGVLTKNIAAGSAAAPPALIAVGLCATVAVLAALGKISQQELNKMADGAAGCDKGAGGAAEAGATSGSSKRW